MYLVEVLVLKGSLVLAVAASVAVGNAGSSPDASKRVVPTGARIGADGFATILRAPPNLEQAAEARPKPPPAGERHWYAEEHRISVDEAKRRLAEQGRWQLTFGHLNRILREREGGNFVAAMLRHEPDWAYVFFFKHDPEQTLKRYINHPRFQAERAVYSEEDRARLIEPWGKRWHAEGIPTTYGLDAVYPTMNVQLGITAEDYQALARERGWGTPPSPIVLNFMPAPKVAAVDPRVAPLLKGFAYERYPTLLQLEALGTGTLRLRNGCLMVQSGPGPEQIAVFHHETGVGLDEQGYLALIDRMSGKVRGRVGEKLAWGAPNAIPEKGMVGLEKLRAACPGELLNIGNPESAAAFNARYGRAPAS